MLDEHRPYIPNGSDGTFEVLSGPWKPQKINFAKRVNRGLSDYSALISAITGLTLSIYVLSDVISRLVK